MTHLLLRVVRLEPLASAPQSGAWGERCPPDTVKQDTVKHGEVLGGESHHRHGVAALALEAVSVQTHHGLAQVVSSGHGETKRPH